MIEIRKLTKSYIIGGKPTMILKWIDLHINQGDFIAVMGPSWSGKSTLINMIGILDTPTSGEYLFEEKNVAGLSEDEQAVFRRDKIWFIFQGYDLLPRLPARAQVTLPLSYKGRWYKKRYNRAVKTLSEVWLAQRINHTPDMLSGGQQQRVCITRALACDPPLLLADEPTGALDSVSSKEILQLFTKLNNQGKTIIMITHDPDVAAYAHKTIHIKDGLIHKIHHSPKT